MKKLLSPIFLFTIICAVCCPHAEGQTYFDFVLGDDGSQTTTHSIIRTIDPQRAIAYYEDGSLSHKLSRIDMYGSIIESKFSSKIEIKDIRIVGNDVFFCGQLTTTRKGLIGHASITDIEAQNTHMEYQYLTIPGFSDESATLWRLAAYDDGTGTIRVVAIGEVDYDSAKAPGFLFCASSLYRCHAFFVVEYQYTSGILSYTDCRFLCEINRYERADDVVVTDNWVAVVTSYPALNAMVIHRCPKNNVVGSLDNYYYYVVPDQEGVSHCCHMKGDTIGIVTLYSTFGTAPYETHMRVVDLATMTMTSAQGFQLLDKAEPAEVVYMPSHATLVMLQGQLFPSTLYHYPYIYWQPYSPTPYLAQGIYENYDYVFSSMDRLTPDHIVLAGGHYWVEKDITISNPTASCYTIESQLVFPISSSSPVFDFYNYVQANILSSSGWMYEVYGPQYITGRCLE